MTYPFSQAPTVDEFIATATSKLGCTCTQIDGIVGPRGPEVLTYLHRETDDGRVVHTDALPKKRELRLKPDLLRHLCRRLEIDPAEFGLTLG